MIPTGKETITALLVVEVASEVAYKVVILHMVYIAVEAVEVLVVAQQFKMGMVLLLVCFELEILQLVQQPLCYPWSPFCHP